MWVSQYFKANEFDCTCCSIGGDEMDPRLLLVADEVRKMIGPLVCNSGYRCPEFNELIGGAKRSKHLEKMAGDFTFPRRADRTPINILRLRIAFQEVAQRHLMGFGIGTYNTFIHFDCRPDSVAFWSEFDYSSTCSCKPKRLAP